jgi:hypothetical protein
MSCTCDSVTAKLVDTRAHEPVASGVGRSGERAAAIHLGDVAGYDPVGRSSQIVSTSTSGITE